MTGFQVVDSKNFYQITAGDYNGDGKDTLVVYNSFVKKMNSTDRYGLIEISLSHSDYIYETLGSDSSGKYLNNDYIRSETTFACLLTVEISTVTVLMIWLYFPIQVISNPVLSVQ